MENIRVVIADDDEGMRLIERKILERTERFTLIGEARDGNELMELVESLHPHVVFLDVEMPGKTGVECGRLIQDMDPSIIMIFATAHDQYMGDAFEVYAFDYLIKPFKMERITQTLSKIRDRLERRQGTPLPGIPRQARLSTGRLMLRHKDGVSFIDMNEILLVQREDRSVRGGLSDGRDVADLIESQADPAKRLTGFHTRHIRDRAVPCGQFRQIGHTGQK